jgi:hypothetical protein
VIVDDRAVAGALRTLHEAPQSLSALTYRARKAEAMLRAVKSLEMKRFNQLPIAGQEREAYASEAYKAAIDEDASASAALISLRASIDAAKITVDIYRTEKATERASFA